MAPTPIRVEELAKVCREQGCTGSDVERILNRFRVGADLGLTGPIQARFCTNNRSATANAEAVLAAIRGEVAAGVTRGPFLTPPFKNFHVNPLSARVKDNGKARVILDMSAPTGHAINELIDPADCSVQYATLDQLALLIAKNGGKGTQIFKADIQAAFKLIPVRPDQHAALGFYWEKKLWYQVALPFGCRMSPKLFNEFATLLRDLPTTTTTYQNLTRLCERVGVPLAPNKCSPPSTRIEILGIIVDTTKMCYEFVCLLGF